MRWLIGALSILGTIASTHAVEVPQGSKFDNRIQFVNYNPRDVVVVRSVAGLGTRIVFSSGETILDVASGFTQGWEFSDRRNMLYIKAKSIPGTQGSPAMEPQAGRWDTNLMVTTNLRVYDIDLHLLPGNNRGKSPLNRVAYRVEYRYPKAEQAAAIAQSEDAELQARLDSKPLAQNWNYTMQIGVGSENIAPTRAFDDGRFTYLTFPNNRDLPSAFLVSPNKTESLVNSHIDPNDPDTLVLQRVSPELVLRLGNAVVAVYNESFDRDGLPASDGTTVPGVKRSIKSAQGQP